MKKSTIVIIFLVAAIISFNACTEDESCDLSSADKLAIENRIESLEDAVNANNLTSFLENMHEDTQYFESFEQDELDALTDNGSTDYDFHDYDMECESDDEAEVSCTATISSAGDEPTSFIVVKDGEWYIYRWEEGDPADVMYRKYSPGQ